MNELVVNLTRFHELVYQDTPPTEDEIEEMNDLWDEVRPEILPDTWAEMFVIYARKTIHTWY